MKSDDIDRMIELAAKQGLHVHASDISQERVDETAKREHEWIGLDHDQLRNTPIEFNRGALWAERYLKERNYK